VEKRKDIILACEKLPNNAWRTEVQLADGKVVTTTNHTGSFSWYDGGMSDISWYDARAFYESEHKLVEVYIDGVRALVTKEVIAEYVRLTKVANDYLKSHRAQ